MFNSILWSLIVKAILWSLNLEFVVNICMIKKTLRHRVHVLADNLSKVNAQMLKI